MKFGLFYELQLLKAYGAEQWDAEAEYRVVQEAIEKGVEGSQFFSYSLGHYYGGGAHEPGRDNLYTRFKDLPEEQRGMMRRGRQLGGSASDPDREPEDEVARALWRAARRDGCIGTPAQVRDTLLQYERNHLDTMIFVAQSGARRHADIMQSIELFGTRVLPEFRERHAEHRAWRSRQLDGVECPINSSI